MSAAPLFDDNERQIMAGACRWVGETHAIPEYVVGLSILDTLKVDCIMHGDDVILDANGESIYTPFIKLNKYKSAYKRVQTSPRHFNHGYHRQDSQPGKS